MFVVRRARPEDAAAIAGFNRAMALETEQRVLIPGVVETGVRRLLETPALGFYGVAERAGGVVACLMVTHEWSDWRNGLFWWIQSVYVQPGSRRQGAYRQLYDFVRAQARSDPGVCGFRLYAATGNAVAHRTYTALGMMRTDYRVYEELRPGHGGVPVQAA